MWRSWQPVKSSLPSSRKAAPGMKYRLRLVTSIASPASNGDYGAEIFIAKTVPVGTYQGKKVSVRANDITTVFAEPRCLIVAISTSILKLLCVSAHSPHAASKEDVAKWMSDLAGVISRFLRPGYQLILGIDANTQLSSEVTSSTGGHGGRCSSKHAQGFIDLLHELGVWLPSTFAPCSDHAPDVDLGTFYPSQGDRPVRIDYIGLLQTAKVVAGTVKVEFDVDLHAKRTDHLPTSLIASLPPSLGTETWKRRVAPYDRKSVNDPEKIQQFREYLALPPKVHHLVEPSSHQHILDQFVLQGLIEFFPKAMPDKRKDFIRAGTFELLVYSGRLHKQKTNASRSLFRAGLYCCFQLWAHRPWKSKWSGTFGFIAFRQLVKWKRLTEAYNSTSLQVKNLIELERIAGLEKKAD